MVTEFSFLNVKGAECHSFDFPVDLKIGDEIWFSDFECFLYKGSYYCTSLVSMEKFSIENFDIPQAKVEGLIYGYQKGKLIKIIALTAI